MAIVLGLECLNWCSGFVLGTGVTVYIELGWIVDKGRAHAYFRARIWRRDRLSLAA